MTDPKPLSAEPECICGVGRWYVAYHRRPCPWVEMVGAEMPEHGDRGMLVCEHGRYGKAERALLAAHEGEGNE